jgi:hypothetical protein
MAQPAPTPIVPLAPAPVAGDAFAVQRAQMKSRTVQQLQQLSARIGQLQGYLSAEDLATLQAAVLKAAQTGSLDPTALLTAMGHAEARQHHASQPFMDTLDAASDIYSELHTKTMSANDAVAADAAAHGAFDPARLQQLQAMSAHEQEFSAAVKATVDLLQTDPRTALAKLQALVVKR